MNSAPAIIANMVRCKNCGKSRNPVDCLGSEARGFTCAECLAWHLHALDVVAGEMPRGCQICDRPWEDIRAAALAESQKENAAIAEARMYVVPKDGLLQVVCKRCVTDYVLKRGDMYRNTSFGKSLNL